MQVEKNNPSIDQKEPTTKLKIGELLVDARNRAALNQTDISEQINLPISIINALENDQFDKLPESPYVRGYLKSYARLVSVDPDEIVRNYNTLHHIEPEVSKVVNSTPNHDLAFFWSTAAVLTILVGLLVTWWLDSDKSLQAPINLATDESVKIISEVEENDSLRTRSDGEVSKTEKEEMVEVESEIEAEPEAERAEIAQADESVHGAVTHENESSLDQSTEYITEEVEQAMEQESQDPTLVTMSNESEILTVTFVEKSWTEIYDADSNTLMQGLIEPGVVKDLNGRPPFQIFLGNSPGVVIEVNGQYFDQSQFNRSNRTARFQVSGSTFN